MERQEQRIARDVRRTHERVRGAIETEKWRSDIKVEHARIQGDANGRAIEGDRKSQWPREQHGGDRRGARLVGDGDTGLTARRRDEDLLRDQRRK